MDSTQARVDAALRRDATLEAVAFAAQRFLEERAWEDVVPEVLRRLGEATQASRAYLFQNHPAHNGELLTTQRWEWVAIGIRPQIDEPSLHGQSWELAGLARWVRVLGEGNVLHGHIREFPDSERSTLERQDIVSILVVPIFVDGAWWGHIGFDECLAEREWSQVEIDALRTAAGILGAAIRRRRDEELLAEAEARFRVIVERTPAVTYQEIVTEEGAARSSLAYVSPQIERILGYPAENWSTIPGFWAQIVHPEDLDRVVTESERTLLAAEPYSQDYRVIAADGAVVWFHDESVPIQGEDGTRIWQGVMVDVTERKHAEEELRRAESRFRALVEHTPAITYRQPVDGDPAGFYVSPQIDDVLGYPAKGWDWSPEFWRDHLHPEDRERAIEIDERTNRTGEPYASEYRFRRADGTYVWMSDQATLVEADGEVSYWQGFMFDITERKQAVEALAETEARFRTLVEQVPAAIYTQRIEDDGSSSTIYISPRAEEIDGYTAEETLADPGLWRRILHPKDRERVLEEDREGNASGEPFSMEYRIIAKDGREVWVRDEASVVRDAEGRPRLWQGFMLDVTERKEAEAHLERALEVERDAAGRLRALDEMKNTFLQAVSHDLRTPLAAILGLAVTLEREDIELASAEARDLAKRIATNARKLDRMVTDLLDLDRLARGIVEPKIHRTDVGELVRRIVSESDLMVQGRIRLSVPSLVASVDASKVERIVENLLANTARHTPSGTPVDVRLEPAKRGFLLRVEDRGPGVPAEFKESIFEPFQQGPQAAPHSPGVGIGLALVARFAELQGGRAWVEDRPGGGASFRVLLADGEPSEAAAQPTAAQPATTG